TTSPASLMAWTWNTDFAMSRPIVLILSMGGSFLAPPQNTAMWHIAMPAEEPSTASIADIGGR
ncbi:MAG: hypothetical protein ABIQ30_02755, partial [Devosia sp.]